MPNQELVDKYKKQNTEDSIYDVLSKKNDILNDLSNSTQYLDDNFLMRQKEAQDALRRKINPQGVANSLSNEQSLLNVLNQQALGQKQNSSDLAAQLLSQKASRDFIQDQGTQVAGNNYSPAAIARSMQASSERNLNPIAEKYGSILSSGRVGAIADAVGSNLGTANRTSDLYNNLLSRYQNQEILQDKTATSARNMEDQNRFAERSSELQREQARRNRKNSAIAAGIGAGASVLGGVLSAIPKMSDKNTKKNMKNAGETIDIILKKIEPTEYEYKDEYKMDPRAGKGKQVGIVAQDLEDAGAGFAVKEDPQSGMKMVDVVSLIPLLLSAQSHLSSKMDQKEDKKTKGKK